VRGVFADTFYWIALTNPRDRHADEVRQFDHLLSEGTVWTTEEVLVEVLTFFAADSALRVVPSIQCARSLPIRLYI
jgi:hypothetical protein